MKAVALKSVDYLEWLKNKEDKILDTITLEEAGNNLFSIEELEEELQMIRDIKDIVKKWGEHECC